MKIVIIDPSSTEFNRGSFCYAAYLTYNGLKELGHEVTVMEAFRPEDLDTIDRTADAYIISFWSYPQIETCELLWKMLPYELGKNNLYYVGYHPLIKKYGFPHVKKLLKFDPLQDRAFLDRAMKSYPKYYKDFKRLLLSDCDMHLKDLDDGQLVYPMFASYGCPNGCSFCPSTKNCGLRRFTMRLSTVLQMLDDCEAQGYKNIHFTDEDFFYSADRVEKILQHTKRKGFRFIALASAGNFYNFIERHGTDILKEGGMEVIEIGFESGDEELSKSMGAGKDLSLCEKLAEMQEELPVHIFWLIQTFFPGETISSLNTTGKFLEKYGLNMEATVGRLRTNGTKGGLGQFFQPYVGLANENEVRANGMFLTDRPIRLIPSYIPNSLLECLLRFVDKKKIPDALPWLKLYDVEQAGTALIAQCCGDKALRVYEAYEDTNAKPGDFFTALAVLSRKGVIQ